MIKQTDYPHKQECLYCPYYCEENIWHLSQHPKLKPFKRVVLFISNLSRQCLLHNQKAGVEGHVIWDYHVVLLANQLVFDFDSLLDFPLSLVDYLNHSFDVVGDPRFRPLFKLIEADVFITEFSSDRSHMLDPGGRFLQSPPKWDMIYSNGNNLDHFIDMQSVEFGAKILSLNEMYDEFR